MSYTVEKLAGLPAVMATPRADFKMETEQAPLQADIRTVLETTDEPLYYIINFLHTHLTLEDLIKGSSGGARNQASPWRHPMIRGIIFVTDDGATKLAVEGLNSPAYGNLNAPHFGTLDDALAYIREAVVA